MYNSGKKHMFSVNKSGRIYIYIHSSRLKIPTTTAIPDHRCSYILFYREILK